MNTNNRNRKKNKEQINIFKPENDTVEGILRWKLENNGSKPGDTIVWNGKTYHWFTNQHGGGTWFFHKINNFNVKENWFEVNSVE